jgi:hypothetical protein
MRGSPKQYGLMLEEGASFAVLQYALNDKTSLISLVRGLGDIFATSTPAPSSFASWPGRRR